MRSGNHSLPLACAVFILVLGQLLLQCCSTRVSHQSSQHGRSDISGEDPNDEDDGMDPTMDLGTTACCCRVGACPEGSKGVRAYPPRFHDSSSLLQARNNFGRWFEPEALAEGMCCLEQTFCDWHWGFSVPEDVSMCLPKGGNGRVRICNSPTKKLHMNLDMGDGGCADLLASDGGFATASASSSYAQRDCPFPGNVSEEQARRQLLVLFHRNNVASYADVSQTCNGFQSALASDADPVANGKSWGELGLNMTGSRWESVLTAEPLQSHLRRMARREVFVCNTLRLLPLLWDRIGMRGVGLSQDGLIPTYPKSVRGQVSPAVNVGSRFICHYYADLSATETLRARRVLRALLPTYSIHVFAQSKYGQFKKGMEYLLGYLPPNPFRKELERVCTAPILGRDVALANAPLKSLLNSDVLTRARGTCSNRFPCAFNDAVCAETKKCACTCYKSMCRTFVYDFHQAMQETFQIDSCSDG